MKQINEKGYIYKKCNVKRALTLRWPELHRAEPEIVVLKMPLGHRKHLQRTEGGEYAALQLHQAGKGILIYI